MKMMRMDGMHRLTAVCWDERAERCSVADMDEMYVHSVGHLLHGSAPPFRIVGTFVHHEAAVEFVRVVDAVMTARKSANGRKSTLYRSFSTAAVALEFAQLLQWVVRISGEDNGRKRR